MQERVKTCDLIIKLGVDRVNRLVVLLAVVGQPIIDGIVGISSLSKLKNMRRSRRSRRLMRSLVRGEGCLDCILDELLHCCRVHVDQPLSLRSSEPYNGNIGRGKSSRLSSVVQFLALWNLVWRWLRECSSCVLAKGVRDMTR